MRRFLALSLVFALGIAAGRSWMFHSAEAGGQPVATDNGDTNGDGSRDLSDAVYLLSWLFRSGPEPAPITPRRFVDNGDGTVTDTTTGLMWLRQSADVDGDGSFDDDDLVSHDEAFAFAEALEFAGHSDWRLPTTAEIAGLVNVGDDADAAFPEFDLPGGSHWVGSTNGGDPCHGARYVVDFRFGSLELRGDDVSTFEKAAVLARRRP